MVNRALKAVNQKISITELADVPAIIEAAGRQTKKRFVEFFMANIPNDNTRAAYLRAVRRFCDWAEDHNITLEAVEPTLVAAYIKEIGRSLSDASVKQHLAAIRMLFDYLVTGGIIEMNPASAVKGPKLVIKKGKTPVLTPESARELLDSIDISKISGLRDRALIGVMVYSFARVGATLDMDVEDLYLNNRQYWIRLHEKGSVHHEMPLHHNAQAYLLEYMDAANLHGQKGTPLFRSLDRRRNLTDHRLHRSDAWRMIKRRARKAGVSSEICNHTFRATGITAYLGNGGTLEKAAKMAAHRSTRSTSLYDRTDDNPDLDEVERVVI